MSELWRLSAKELRGKVQKQEVTAREAINNALDRIDTINSSLNAIVDLCRDDALRQANDIDQRIANGEKVGPLSGVPVTVKVNIDQVGYATTNGLKIQAGKIATEDSPIVRSIKANDGVIVGRTNTPAFSLRWFTRNQLHGNTLNPINPSLTPGGSSGGAASAVSSGMCALAHGTDIAGSIRYPAYACGIHGLRPSLGRIPVYNSSAPDRFVAGQLMAVSGPLARTIDDIELGLDIMSSCDARDPWWFPTPSRQPPLSHKVALCMNTEEWAVTPAVKETVLRAAEALSDAGWQVEEKTCPSIRCAADMNLALWMAEMEAAGGRKLVSQENDPDANLIFERLLKKTHPLTASDLLQIIQARAGLVREWQLLLNDYPVILCPVSGCEPFNAQKDVGSEKDFDSIIEAQLFQIGLPVLGLPALAVAREKVNQLPTGVQLVGQRFREDHIIKAGKVLELGLKSPGFEYTT